MKYQTGDLILVKETNFFPGLYRRPHTGLNNTVGIITRICKYNDFYVSTVEGDKNGYIWYSQVDGQEYFFHEDDINGEIVK